MRVEDILVFYHLSFKGMFVFSAELWRCTTRVLGWRKNSSSHCHSHSRAFLFENVTIILLDEMRRQNHVPPHFAFTSILESLVRIKQYHTVISLFKEMKLNGTSYDFVILSIVIKSFLSLI